MHDWGDEGVDWVGIGNAAHYLSTYMKKWGRLSAHSKEKYGTVRCYCHFGYLSLHGLIYPGYVYNQFPKWLWHLDCMYISKFLQFFFEKPYVKWQVFIYKRAYQNALKKWPHLRKEILCAADHRELIK